MEKFRYQIPKTSCICFFAVGTSQRIFSNKSTIQMFGNPKLTASSWSLHTVVCFRFLVVDSQKLYISRTSTDGLMMLPSMQNFYVQLLLPWQPRMKDGLVGFRRHHCLKQCHLNVKVLLVFVSSSGTSLCKKTPTDKVKSNKSLEICSVNEL